MKYLHVGPNNKEDIEMFNKHIKNGKGVFALIYLEGCGPCNETRPEWKKIENVTKKKYSNNDDVLVAEIDQKLLNEIKGLNIQPKGFPTMIYISENGKKIEDYEDSDIDKKDRTIDSFVKWIESKNPKQNGGKKSRKNMKNKLSKTRKNLRGGKWSLKYKRSINCKKPKGFSQRQYCKYGR
jgi:hypothetical protein